jgi:hypothetical protein
MIGKITVFAAGPTARFLWPTLALVGALLAGAVIIALFERWRKRPPNEGLSAGDQLSHFRNLYEQGAMSKEEFEAVKVQLSGKLRDELKLTPPPAESPPTAEPTQPPEPPTNGAVKG